MEKRWTSQCVAGNKTNFRTKRAYKILVCVTFQANSSDTSSRNMSKEPNKKKTIRYHWTHTRLWWLFSIMKTTTAQLPRKSRIPFCSQRHNNLKPHIFIDCYRFRLCATSDYSCKMGWKKTLTGFSCCLPFRLAKDCVRLVVWISVGLFSSFEWDFWPNNLAKMPCGSAMFKIEIEWKCAQRTKCGGKNVKKKMYE